MKIHEYQGKEILRQFNVPVPNGIPAHSVDEAVEAAKKSILDKTPAATFEIYISDHIIFEWI